MRYCNISFGSELQFLLNIFPILSCKKSFASKLKLLLLNSKLTYLSPEVYGSRGEIRAELTRPGFLRSFRDSDDMTSVLNIDPNTVAVRAGRCLRRDQTSWVDPQPEKGLILISPTDEGLINWRWASRTSNVVQEVCAELVALGMLLTGDLNAGTLDIPDRHQVRAG